MRDDVTPTNPQPIDVLRAQIEAFRENPDDAELYRDLREQLRTSGQAEPFAEISEERGPHESDPIQAAEVWSEAGEARLLLGHDEQGRIDLQNALELDGANERAAARLTESYMVASSFAEAAATMEKELEILEERAAEGDDPHTARRSQRHRMLAQLWDERLCRIDRALHHWRQAWKLEPERTEALEAARAIYASLGRDDMVAELLQAEIESLSEDAPAAHRAALELELGQLIARQGRTADAAIHLEAAVRADATSIRAREALADVYSSPDLAGDESHQERASALFVELGKSRLATEDRDGAIGYLRRALGVNPYSRAGTENLEDALALDERWDELERLLRHQEALAEDDATRAALLKKRAALYEERIDDRQAQRDCLQLLLAHEPPGGPAATRLRELLREDEEWDSLGALIEHEVPMLEGDPEKLAHSLLELATIAREHLGDRDRAAEHLHRILTIDPNNQEALARYHDHFRERRDWRGLADLTEFAIENARDAGAEPGQIVRQLEGFAQLVEHRLGDVDRTVATWQRVQQLEPQNPRATEALRRLASRAKMWQSLASVLEQEATAAAGPEERCEALRRMAKFYRDRQVNPRRAISLYEEVLTVAPGDEPALKALAELYEREGDDAGLANTLRRQLEIDAHRARAEATASGTRPSSAREWPVAIRVERLTTLRRLASMYEQRLADVEGVVFAGSGILEILPGDRDALDRMERVLDKSGDAARLEQTLEYHAEAATGPAERAKVLRRLARIAQDRQDEPGAMERWERVLQTAPNDGEALAALAQLYERHKRWEELATVLERELGGSKLPQQGTPAAARRSVELKRYARVVDDELQDAGRAKRAWKQVLKVSPRDREALDALARLFDQAGQWRDLAGVLEQQAPLYVEGERSKAAEVALRRAQLLEKRLGAPVEAIKALEALITEVDPANLEAHEMLRRLYEARGDFNSAVRIAERELYLASSDEERVARGLEIGMLCRDRLGDATRALQAFERVLAVEPAHDDALHAVAELYAQVGAWRRHVASLETLIERTTDGPEKRSFLLRIAHATAERLHDHSAAFTWYRRAHDHAPDATTIAELRRAAEAYGLWAELAEVYADECSKLCDDDGNPTDQPAFVAACRHLAAIAERRLGDCGRAMNALLSAVQASPADEGLLGEAERIALENDDEALWRILLECLAVPIDSVDHDGKVALHVRRARIAEERLEEPETAVEELLRAFAWAPERDETRQALYALAERTRRWNDVVAIETALFERAKGDDERVAILRRKAQVIEENLHERVRAFRTHLSALLLLPEDPETASHLWRLAREIGTYRAADRTPRPEPPAAHVELRADTGSPVAKSLKGGPAARAGDPNNATQELTITDLIGLTPPPLKREDPTIELDVADIESDDPRADPTIELRTEDLIQALSPVELRKKRNAAEADDAARRAKTPLPGVRRGPPPPPPRPPQIRKQSNGPGKAPPGLASAPRPPQPTLSMPVRAYESAWEEFATAYDILPSGDNPTRSRWLFRAAEVWESGAEDITRAFDTLKQALDLTPDDSEPRDRLHRLAREHGAWDRLADLYESAAEAATTADAAAALFLEVASIRADQKQSGMAERMYRRVLGIHPDHTVARERLDEIYRSERRWVDLAASLEERTDPRLGAAAPEAERPALLRELATLYSEELERPHDALDALERLRQLAPDNCDVLRDIARINERMGRWSAVIDALSRLSDVAEGTSEARDAMRRIGEIYHHEIELPDRAIDAYVRVTTAWPNDLAAYEALDTLYEAHARWHDLADILRRRAGLTEGPSERAALLRRRARVLIDWLDAPDEAAAALRHARTIAPDDPGLGDDLVDALTRAGRAREAAAVLEERVDAMREGKAAAGDIAALLIRLAQTRTDALDDRDGAREALERALELVPDHPTALSAVARLAESDGDPRAYAEARIREAKALADVDDRVAALLDAGETLRDRCDDIEAAREAIESAVALQPANAEATWALAGLIEEGGDLDAATQLLENRLESPELSVDEKARILTQLAALARRAGVDAAAERHLDEALNLEPVPLPAAIAKADLLGATDRPEELEEFLARIVPQLQEAPGDALAELYRRQAQAYEELDRADDAYQTLLEADRLHRGNLLVKLALGENRYRARRWREAALHLSAVGDHDDAAKYSADVAEGLYHAALAEIRSLRPEKATALYTRALELKPNYGPALHALAEQAMERGDMTTAADLLTRQATATEEPAERLKLFEALGDLALMSLRDEERARVCYDAAVNAANPLESKHLPLLEKLLERQDLADDNVGTARTAELMASFGATPEERAARYTAAAQGYLAAGEDDRARAAADRAIEADPYSLTGITVMSDILLQREEYEQAAAILGRALMGSEPADEIEAARRAELWRRLGAARQSRGDVKGAINAFERTLEAGPDSDPAMRARRELIDLWDDDEGKADTRLGFLRLLARAEHRPDDVLALGRALSTRVRDDDPASLEEARAILELADALGAHLSEEDKSFLADHPPRTFAPDQTYGVSLSKKERAQIIDDPEGESLDEIFEQIWSAAALLWSESDRALARNGVEDAVRVSSATSLPAAMMFPHVARALGLPATMLYTSLAPEAPEAQVVCVSPPVVVLGGRLASNELELGGGSAEETRLAAEVRFTLGHAAAMAMPARVIAIGQPREHLEDLLGSLERSLAPSNRDGGRTSRPGTADEMLRKTLPVKVRTEVERIIRETVPSERDIDRFLPACERAADRAGLLACGDIATAVAMAGGGKQASHLADLILGDDYIAARLKLGIRVARG